MAEAALGPEKNAASAVRRQADLIAALCDRFHVRRRFARAYLDYWEVSTGRAFTSLQEIFEAPHPWPMWFDFAMSTNLRGIALRERIQPYLRDSTRRYLDVGCGFGGFLVAFAELGMQVCGLEIDPVRISLAQANCDDYGLRDCVHQASILEEGLQERIGQFDVITCVDVIEHVLDADRALANMAQLLRPGGLLVLEIPNKDSLSFIAQDGHFSLFGITLLDRSDAIEYHRAHFAFEYDVGDYYLLDHYRQRLAAYGCQTELLGDAQPRWLSSWEFLRKLIRVLAAYARFLLSQRPALPKQVAAQVHSGFLAYLGSIALDGAQAFGRPDASESFRIQYLTDFWTLLARKPY